MAQNRRVQIDLQKTVDQDPSNVFSWLKLIDHQDTMLHLGGTRRKRVSKAEQRSTADIKLSIIDKALDSLDKKDISGRESLWERWFDVVTEVWDPERVLSKYHSILERYPIMHNIWVKYLNFRQTDFASFKYPEIVGCYRKCLAILRTAIFERDQGSSGKLSPRRISLSCLMSNAGNLVEIQLLEEITIYVIFRGIHLMLEAGFPEPSVAILQALLELNFCTPQPIRQSYPENPSQRYDSVLQEFETFWDSEVLRFGEPGAEGWDRFVATGNTGPVLEAETIHEHKLDDNIDESDPFGFWADTEVETSGSKGVWPARTTDDIAEADPFKVIFFTDIIDWMHIFLHNKTMLVFIDRLLGFCGLPSWFSIGDVKTIPRTNDLNDPFLLSTFPSSNEWMWPVSSTGQKMIAWDGTEADPESEHTKSPFTFQIDGGYPLTVDTLFGRKDGEWVFPMMGVEKKPSSTAADAHLAASVLKMILAKLDSDAQLCEKLALYYLAIEWRKDPVR